MWEKEHGWYVGGERGGEQRRGEGLAVILVCTRVCVYIKLSIDSPMFLKAIILCMCKEYMHVNTEHVSHCFWSKFSALSLPPVSLVVLSDNVTHQFLGSIMQQKPQE